MWESHSCQKCKIEGDDVNPNLEALLQCERDKSPSMFFVEATGGTGASLSKAVLKYVYDYSTAKASGSPIDDLFWVADLHAINSI